MSSKKNQGGDDRFLKVTKDPRFWEMPEREHKIKIDKRFQSMFHDDRFKLKYTVDKRGRPFNHTSSEDLKRFYNLSDSEEEEDAKNKKVVAGKKKKKKVKEKPDSVEGGDTVVVKAEKLQKKGKAVQSSDGNLKGEQPVRGVQVEKDDDDEEEQQSIDEDDVYMGDSIPDHNEDKDDDDDDDDNDTEAESELESGSDAKSGSESEEEDSDSEPDLARGLGNIETSSDEDEVDTLLRQEEEEIEHDWGELCKDAPRNDEVSARLAVCNMNWDRIKAKDLLALLNSFKAKDGVVLSVKIYPSQFGKERLAMEQTQAPKELVALPEDSEEDTEEEKGYREKMRDYQFKRLKYYYAVVECDSPDTAVKLYEECDGFEYESSSSILDLRFIPDDVTFDDEPKDVATDVDLSAYTPKLFTSSATAMSKVEVTWDETDHDRVAAMNRKFNKDELLEMDLKAYLASSSEEDDDDEGGLEFGEHEEGKDEETADAKQAEEAAVEGVKKPKKKKESTEQISKYREILKSIQDKEKHQDKDKDMEMEITWVPGLKEATQQRVTRKLEGKDKLTPWEEFLEKKKEKKKQKKVKRKQASAKSDLSDDELPPDVDLNDPFFSEELGSTDDLKKKTKGKKNKKAAEQRTPEEEEELMKRKAEMALLMDDEDAAEHKHFNYDKIVEQQNLSKQKKKKLLKKNEAVEDDNFQVDVKDPRFQAMFTSHLYNLDPSDSSYRKTKGTQSILAEKQRRREEEEEEEQQQQSREATQDTQGREQEVGVKKQEKATASSPAVAETPTTKTMDPGLSTLIKSIKNKTEQFQARKKQKIA